MRTLKPKRLNEQNFVFLIAPSGFVNNEKVQTSVANMNKLGLFPMLNQELSQRTYGYFSGTDQQRLDDLMFCFDNVGMGDGVFCIRGGFGATRLLPLIRYDSVINNPIVFVGYSDITALQSAFFTKCGLVSFHGIVSSSNFTEYTINQINDLIFDPKDNYQLPIRTINVLNEGITQGQIVGGNLSLLVSLIGTEYLYSFSNKIVFIEDIGEPPYKIDRMLTQLLQATDLSKANAIVFGSFHKCSPADHDSAEQNSFTIEQIILQNFEHFRIPIVYDVNFGHIQDSLIFPIGVAAELDTRNKTVTLLENAVV
jgi:muramoyltetrapeptide carboxypeptidase